MNLLYELEYKCNELRKQCIRQVEYNNLTLREIYDLGFNNIDLQTDNHIITLGYLCKKYGTDKYEYGGYDMEDLTDEMLDTEMRFLNVVDSEYIDDRYLNLYIECVDKDKERLFVGDK